MVLTFEDIPNTAEIGDYYNGGAGGDLGISFGAGALALVSDQSGGGGNFDSGSSGSTIAFFQDGDSAIMNVLDGFTTGFSFNYAAFQAGSVNVFSDVNATGDLLASFELPQSVFGVRPEGWESVGVAFDGLAYSVSFGGAAGEIAFDDITLGSSVAGGSPVPEPSTYAAILGALMLSMVIVRRRRAAAV